MFEEEMTEDVCRRVTDWYITDEKLKKRMPFNKWCEEIKKLTACERWLGRRTMPSLGLCVPDHDPQSSQSTGLDYCGQGFVPCYTKPPNCHQQYEERFRFELGWGATNFVLRDKVASVKPDMYTMKHKPSRTTAS